MCDHRRARGAGAGLAPVTCASSRIALRGTGIRVARDVMCLFFSCPFVIVGRSILGLMVFSFS